MPFMPQITNIPQAQNTQGAVFRAPQRPQVSMEMIKAASGSPLAQAASNAMSELGGFISDRAFQNDLSKANGLESLMALQPTSAKQFAMLQQKEGQFNTLQKQAMEEKLFRLQSDTLEETKRRNQILEGLEGRRVGVSEGGLDLSKDKFSFTKDYQNKAFDFEKDYKNRLFNLQDKELKRKLEQISYTNMFEDKKLEENKRQFNVQTLLQKQANAISSNKETPAQQVISKNMADKAVGLASLSDEDFVDYFDAAGIDIDGQEKEFKIMMSEILRNNPQGYKIGGYQPKQLLELFAKSKDKKLDPNTYSDWIGNTSFDLVHKDLDTSGKPLLKNAAKNINKAAQYIGKGYEFLSVPVQEELTRIFEIGSFEERQAALKKMLEKNINR